MPIFHRNSTASSSSTRSVDDPTQSRSSKLFGHHASHSPTPNSSISSTHRPSLLRQQHADSSIQAARDQVSRAEAAEREADKALAAARKSVQEARGHVKRLEREAAEEYVIFALKFRGETAETDYTFQ